MYIKRVHQINKNRDLERLTWLNSHEKSANSQVIIDLL